MSDAAQKAVEVIDRHRYSWSYRMCQCQTDNPDAGVVTLPEHAAHVLAVLSETHAVVELPEPEEELRNGLVKWSFGEGYEWSPQRSVAFVPDQMPDHGISYNGLQFHTPATADRAAAALLAAARRARKDGTR